MSAISALVAGEQLVEAAGGLVWRWTPDGLRVAVIRRAKVGDWRLPKGKRQDGEDFEAAALREVAEETGCEAELVEFAGYTLALGKRRPKLVLFWHMVARRAGLPIHASEVDRVEWLSLREAQARIHHVEERRLLGSARPPRTLRAPQGLKARAG